MRTKRNLTAALALLALLSTLNLQLSTAYAQGTTAFTYQGQLRDGGTNANGVYTMIFKLYDAAGGGNQIGGTITTTPTLANGLFTVNLDFGANAFNGGARWLDITVQSGLDAQTLTPRVLVQPSPYAIYAGTAASAASLSASTWNATAGNYQGFSNVFGIFDNNNLVLGMSTNGCMMNGDFEVAGDLSVDGSFSPGTVNFKNGGSISGDGHGGLNVNSTVGFENGGSISSDGHGGLNVNGTVDYLTLGNLSLNSLNLSGNLSANSLTATNGTLALGNYPDWTLITSDGNGGFSVEGAGIGGTDIGPGGINLTGGININSGTVVIPPNGNITCMWINGFGLNVTNGISCSYLNCSGVVSAQSFNTTSDRNLKEKFVPVDSLKVLARVANLPISSWNFKNDSTRHIGPMAQDFYATFNVGPDDKHIATVDEGGVALAAIQGLNQKLDEKDAELQQLKSQNESLEKRLADLEALVKRSAHP